MKRKRYGVRRRSDSLRSGSRLYIRGYIFEWRYIAEKLTPFLEKGQYTLTPARPPSRR